MMKIIIDKFNTEFYIFVEFGALILGVLSLGFGLLALLYGIIDFGSNNFFDLIMSLKFLWFGFAMLFGLKVIRLLSKSVDDVN